MKVLFLPWFQPTHYFHMVPLAWAIRAAGHDVRIAGHPDIADAVKNSGLTFSRIEHSYDLLSDTSKAEKDLRRYLQLMHKAFKEQRCEPGAESALSALENESLSKFQKRPELDWVTSYVRVAVAMADEVVELARSWRPDLVIADPFILAAPLAAAPTRAPLIHHLWGPALFRRAKGFPGSGLPVELWPDDLQQLFDTFGVDARAEHAVGSVDNCPASIQYPLVPDRIPCRFVPYNGPGDAPAWLLEPPTRPRICITWGTLTSTIAGPEGFLVPRILGAIAALDADIEMIVTVTAADRALLPDPAPKNVRIIERLPLHLLLPTCTAVLHQGGAGSMLTAAAAGIPQIVVSGLTDQRANGRRLSRTGAGVALDWANVSISAITAATSTMLASGTRQAARRLQEEITALPTPADLVTTLSRLP